MERKWEGETPDMSDGATYLVLLGYGGGLDRLISDGRWDRDLTDRLRKDRKQIFQLLEEPARLAATGLSADEPNRHK